MRGAKLTPAGTRGAPGMNLETADRLNTRKITTRMKIAVDRSPVPTFLSYILVIIVGLCLQEYKG